MNSSILLLVVASLAIFCTASAADSRVEMVCIADVGMATLEIAKAGLQIDASVRVCDGSDASGCTAAIAGAVSSLAYATAFASQAVTDCCASGSACVTDVARTVGDLSGATSAIAKATAFCGASGDIIKCAESIAKASVDVVKAGVHIAAADVACSASASFSEMPPRPMVNDSCVKDITLASAEIANAAKQIDTATHVCSTGNQSALCSAAISGAISSLASATAYVSEAVTDCGGTGSQCATDLANCVAALSATTSDISLATISCGHNGSTIKCTEDLTRAGINIAKAVEDIAAAIDDC